MSWPHLHKEVREEMNSHAGYLPYLSQQDWYSAVSTPRPQSPRTVSPLYKPRPVAEPPIVMLIRYCLASIVSKAVVPILLSWPRILGGYSSFLPPISTKNVDVLDIFYWRRNVRLGVNENPVCFRWDIIPLVTCQVICMGIGCWFINFLFCDS